MFGELRNGAGERLDYTYTPAAAPGSDRLVVIGHGVTANKDREWALTLAAHLSEAGCASLRFSFAGNGESEGAYADSCPTKEAGDLRAVLAHLRGAGVAELIYAGHSMGGAVGVLVAARDPQLVGLVSLAGMVDTADFAARKFGGLTPGRDLMWDKPECPLSQAFLDDMRAVGSVAPLATRVACPWLLVHGTEDTVVPFAESEALVAAWAADGRELPLDALEGADHVFSGPAAAEMARRVAGWVRALEL